MFLKRFAVFVVVFFLGGLLVHAVNDEPITDLRIPFFFWGMMLVLWGLYYAFLESRKGKVLRELHPVLQHMLSFGYIVFIFLIVFDATVFLFEDNERIRNVTPEDVQLLILFSTSISVVAIAVLKIVNIIGPRQFLPFMFGTFYKPVERQKVVMFIDMVGSSSVAEKLEPVEAQKFIGKFIFDMSGVVRRSGGDVVNFTGDGLVAVWNVGKAHKALKSVGFMYEEIELERKDYEEAFEAVPEFRVGVHLGPVVLSQIGEEKLFLGLYGDVVNTASRLEALNKDFGCHVLASQAVVDAAGWADRKDVVSRGEVDIRGRQGKVNVFELQLVNSKAA